MATLHQLFEAAVDRTPQAVALIDGTREVTYAELEAQANRIARQLRRHGAGPETPVGICTERNAGMVAALLGTLKAGAAYLALDPAYPRERLEFLMGDAATAVAVTEEALLDRLPEGGPVRLCLDRDAAVLAAESPERLPCSAGAGSLAYVIYTSGSTGRPKGVALEHRSAVALCRWAKATFPAAELAVMLAATSINFDLSVFEIFVPLSAGHTVVLAENALALPGLPAAGRVTFVNTVPSAMAELVRSGGLPAAVRAVGLAGEPLKRALVERIYAAGPVGAVYNLYGPTEDTTYSTWTRVARGAAEEPTIGRPVTGTVLHLLTGDPAPSPAAPGEVGEIFLGGDGLARGYLGRPELTAERFLPDPFSGLSGARLYRVGDLGRRTPDGDVQFLGRVDHQVKIRGFRIELGEIEAALDRHPAVQESVVVAAPAPGGDEEEDRRLVAYLETRTPPDPAELRAFLTARLPAHFVPSLFVPLAALPRTLNGKVDRKALPAPDWSAGSLGAAPRSALEERVAEIWAEVLGLPRVGRHDAFLALGGHSLLATRIVSRLREACGVEIPLRRLFEAATVAGLAAAIETAAPAEEGAPTPVPRNGDLPPSFAQQRLWVIDRLDPGSPAYNIPWAVRLTGPLDVALLGRVFAEIVRRHEALRTTFAARDGRPAQRIQAPFAPELPVVDLSGLAGPSDRTDRSDRSDPSDLSARQARQARQVALDLLRAAALRPFDLSQGPLLRLLLVRLGSGEHVLSVLLHHIVSDDGSMEILVREVGALAAAFAAGGPSPLPELALQVADFAVWQRRRLQGKLLEKRLAAWRRALAGAPQVLDLPTDRPRPPRPTFRGGGRPVEIPPALAAAVGRRSREAGATPFMALLTAWAVLLGRHAGQDDLLVGSPVAGRNHRAAEAMIGFFVNTLPLRVTWEPATTMRTLLDRVRATCLDAFENQDVPFERLVEELVPARDPSRNPLVQALFAWQTPDPPLEIPGVTTAPFPLDSPIAKFDLVLSLGPAGEAFAGGIEHSADLFDAGTAERLAARFLVLLATAADDPERPVAELPLLPEAERRQILAGSGETAAAPPAASWNELFAAAARRFPEAPAVIGADGTQWSYRRLDEASNRLARRLRASGVGLDEAVGICVERSPELIVGLTAILKAGGAYLPLNPDHPDERLRFQVEDAGTRLVLVQAATRSRLEGCARLEIDPAALAAAGEDASPPGLAVPPECLAYVLYTSGSTGAPKGVGVSHRAVVEHALSILEEDALGPGDRVIQFASLSFDVSIEQIFPTLLAGSAVVLRGEDLAHPEAMLPAFRRLGITVANLPTAWWQQAVRALPEADDPDLPPLRLRMQTVGGEALLPEAARRWLELTAPLRLGGVRLVNGYGPTETVVTATRFDVSHHGAVGTGAVLLGRLLPRRSGSVLDPQGQLQPIGVPGELLLGGILARGYVNRPELTAERFVPDPFGTAPGGRLYRTGDLVRQLPTGDLDYLGRIDRQVKIRGIRIEPGEIESALAALPGVRDCAVVARADAPGGGLRLVAYVAGRACDRDGAALTPEALRRRLAAQLPDFLVPAAFVLLDALPLTANGKVDRQALPAPSVDSDRLPAAAALDPVEELLAGIWAEILGLARVGRHDDVFLLGGHSLLATQVVSRIRKVLHVELPLRTLFEARTVADLARAVHTARGLEAAETPPLLPQRREGDPPLSFAQQRLWLTDQLDPGNPAYNLPWATRLTGPLDVPRLTRVFQEILRRHEALRTTFALRDDRPVQRIHAPFTPELPVVDLAGLAGASHLALALAREEAQRPFDLAQGPLLRLHLLRLGAEDHVLLVLLHHIVADAWSLGVLRREVGLLAAAFAAGLPSPLPALPVQSADVALWQRHPLQDERLESLLAGWRRDLAGAPQVLALPVDRPRPPLQTFRGGTRPVALEPALGAAVRRLGQEVGATPFMALLAAWAVHLGRHAGQEDLLLGAPIAGRTHREMEDLIGFFANTLVLRCTWDGTTSFRDLLVRQRTVTLDAYDRQEVPFERLVEALVPQRDLSRSPLVQALFALQNAPELPLVLPGLTATPFPVESQGAQFELVLALRPEGDGFAGEIEYNADLFDDATVERLWERFQVLLEDAVGDPDRPVADLALLPAGAVPPPARPDLQVLPAPAAARSAGGGATSLDPLEDLLAGLWAEVLGLDRVDVHDHFFTLGGHSLLAARVIARLRALLGVELSLRQMFAAGTVAGLARVVREARHEGAPAAEPLVRLPREGGLPLSFAQQRFWFQEQVHPGRAVFHLATLYALRGPLDRAAFVRALAATVERHEALRTTIAEVAGEPRQLVRPPEPPDLPRVDLSALPPAAAPRAAERAAADLTARPFVFGREPLARHLLLHLSADEHRYLAVVHHLLSDGLSQAVFERDLAALYEEATTGRPAGLAPLPVQSGDWAAWQRLHLTDDRLADALAGWRRRLAPPLPVLRLPTDRPRPAEPGDRGGLRARTLPAELVTALRGITRREGSTLYITLLTAFVVLLHRTTGARDLLLGTPVSFRDRPEVEDLIGLFVNTLVIRAEVTPDAGFRAHLAHVRERVLEAFGHQEVPFEKLVEELRPERGPHDTPFFQLFFALLHQTETARRAGPLVIRRLDLPTASSPFELTLYVHDAGTGLVARVEYRTELFDAATIERLLASYQALLAAALAAPDLPVAELPFEPWAPEAPAAPPPPVAAPTETLAARTATLEEKRAQLTDEQRERLRQRLRRG